MKPSRRFFVLYHFEKEIYQGTEVECERYLEKIQPHSAMWAMMKDGYRIEEEIIDEDPEEGISDDL